MFFSGPATSLSDSLLSNGQWRIDEDDRIAFVRPASLQQQRGVENHGLRMVWMMPDLLPDFGSDRRVHDFIELGSPRLMIRRFSEDLCRQAVSINLTGSIQHSHSKHSHDRVANQVN